MKDYERIFNDSYESIINGSNQSTAFFDRFYEIFTSSSPEIAAKFEHTDMTNQAKMLKKSMFHVFNFFITRKASDYMEEIARKHNKSNLNIPPFMYDLWLESIIKAVSEFDRKFNRDVELAWRMVLSMGITYMKFAYEHTD